MSYSALYTFNALGDAVADTEYRNSHGTAALVWDCLVRKYETIMYPNDTMFSPRRFAMDCWGDLVNKESDGTLPLRWWERNALQFTYDYAVTKREDFLCMADSLEFVSEALVLPKRVNHLPAIVKRLRELFEDETVRGVGLYATSVSDNPWQIWEEDYKGRPYNIDADKLHFFVDVQRANP